MCNIVNVGIIFNKIMTHKSAPYGNVRQQKKPRGT